RCADCGAALCLLHVGTLVESNLVWLLFAPFVLLLLLSKIIVEMGFYSQGVSKTIPFVRHYPTGLDAPVSPINLFVVAQYHLLIKGMRTSEPREQLLTLLVQPRLILLPLIGSRAL